MDEPQIVRVSNEMSLERAEFLADAMNRLTDLRQQAMFVAYQRPETGRFVVIVRPGAMRAW